MMEELREHNEWLKSLDNDDEYLLKLKEFFDWVVNLKDEDGKRGDFIRDTRIASDFSIERRAERLNMSCEEAYEEYLKLHKEWRDQCNI